MTYTLNDQHVAEALARFTEQFKNKPNLTKLVAGFVERTQGVENVAWEIYNARMLDNAADARLDDIGAIVGQPRDGRADPEYRQWISARIVINRSNGTPNDTLHVLELIVPDYTPEYAEYYPAAYAVRLYDYPGDFDTVFNILREVKPAGVRLYFEYSDVAETVLFTYAPGSALVSGDTARGYADATSPGTGGAYAGVLSA
jgi:hypothetical protein